MKRVILIGGAPGTGKSTVAQGLSKELGLPWISTDQLRGVVRDYASPDKHPGLVHDDGLDTAETFLTHYTAKEIADLEYRQAYDVWPAVRYLINETYGWKDGVIIEGVNIIPELLEDTLVTQKVQPLFLIDEDQDRLHDVVYGRGIWDTADSYSDDLKPKEVAWVTLFTQLLKESALKHDMPVIEVQKDEADLPKILKILDDAH